MPNRHFGEIGDVWKHLPLSSILYIEQPSEYWETHSGSAVYEINNPLFKENKWKKEYGVIYYYKQAISNFPLLLNTVYTSLLKKYGCADSMHNLTVSLGSPLIALSTLPNAARFIFCDTAAESLISISQQAQSFNNVDKLLLVHKDGNDSIMEQLIKLPKENVSKVLLFLDPYEAFDKNTSGISSVDLFYEAFYRGVKVVLWYGFDTITDQLSKKNKLKEKYTTGSIHGIEILFTCIDKMKINPGVCGGCSMILGNCSDLTIVNITQLGNELINAYKNVLLPDGSDGSLQLQQFELKI